MQRVLVYQMLHHNVPQLQIYKIRCKSTPCYKYTRSTGWRVFRESAECSEQSSKTPRAKGESCCQSWCYSSCNLRQQQPVRLQTPAEIGKPRVPCEDKAVCPFWGHTYPTQETGAQVSQYLQSSDEGEGLLYVHRNPRFIRDGLQSSEQAGIYNIQLYLYAAFHCFSWPSCFTSQKPPQVY